MVPPTLFCDTCGAANQPKASFCRTCGHPLQPAGAASRNTATGRLLPNHLLKQRYLIIDSVGKGGMGAVYKGEDTQLGNRRVAIKEMSQSGLSPQEVIDAANDFKREAHILAGLQHPNLPNIYDHFPEAGRWYLVMSFIQGETLEDYLNKAKGGRLPVEEVLQIGVQLCTVLNYLHSQQPPIIFRDLKPSNIMCTVDRHLYLIDFGIARHFKPGQAKDTTAYGSIGYASPEQYGKAQTTPHSDIYSLGAVLYQLLSGHDPSATPFRFPNLQSLVPTAPTELVRLITQMLEMDENNRPTSMLVVKQQLQAVVLPPAPTVLSSVSASAVSNPKLPKPIAPAKSIVKPIKVWDFGRNQLILALVCAICYGLASFAILSAFIADARILIGLLFVFPIFFGSAFGPWVATIATGIGIFSANFIILGLSGHSTFYSFFWGWWFAAAITLSGFFAGFILFKTQRQYNKFGNIAFTTLIGLVDMCFALALIFLIDKIKDPFFSFGFFFTNYIIGNIPCLILLPLLLLSYNAITRRRSKTHP